jgi:branched-chain amino acid transport system substrate-binding protein
MLRFMMSLMMSLAVCPLMAGTAAADPVKIAVIENLSGPGSTTNREFALATRYWVEQVNAAGGIRGARLDYLEYDSQGTTATAAEKFRSAVADGAQIIVQGGSSGIAGQLTEDVRKYNLRNPAQPVLYINPGSEALELTGEKCHFYFFRFATNAEMRVKSLVSAMKQAGDLGAKVFSINQNYSWGKDMQAAIDADAALGGYGVVDRVLHDTNKIQDFSPYVARIKASGADTVITGNWASDLVLLVKEIATSGLKVKFGAMFLDLPGSLESAGDAALGYYTVESSNKEVGGEATLALYGDYNKRVGHDPSSSETRTLFALQTLQAALGAIDLSKRMDVTALARALENAKAETPMGEVSVRAADHQASVPLIVSVVSTDAKYKRSGLSLGLKPVKTVPGPEAINPVQPSCKMEHPA